MGLTTRNIPQLFNGISKQPAILRAQDQTSDELNSWASVSSGVGKRPPSEYVAKLANSLGADAFVHVINRDTEERYVVVIENGVIKVIGFDGVERTVNAPGGTAYLDSNNLAAVTVADYTFIVNRDKMTGLKTAGQDEQPPPAYTRNIERRQDVDSVLGVLIYLAGQQGGYAPNPVITGGITGSVTTMEKLPTPVPHGAVYEVRGSSAQPFASFYVRGNNGVWDECVRPGLKNAIDEATMPHCLIREGDGTFTFAPFSWAPRRVGDENTNPNPTFIGRRIRDVFFYQNRLALLVDENVILSCAGDFGNFWRNTVLDVIDSDVVDVAITTANVAPLEHAVLFNDGALLFADQTQFSMTNGEDGVTPASMSLLPVTHYTINKETRPVALGTEVYFIGDAVGHSAVYEYTRMKDSEATTAADITAHVPGLLPRGLKHLSSSTRALFAFTGGKDAYTYQIYWNGNEKLMSAWRRWSFLGDVIASTVVDDRLYLVTRYSDGIYLERLDLSDKARPATQPYQVYLDRRVELTGTYDANADRTTYVLPYPVDVADRPKVQLILGNGSAFPHKQHPHEDIAWVSATTFTVKGNVTGTSAIGLTYDHFIEFSQQFPVDHQGRPLTTGRLQLRQFTVRYSESAYFEVEVYPYGRAKSASLEDTQPVRKATFTGLRLGSGSTVLGQPAYESGSFSFSVAGEAKRAIIRLVNNSYTGATFSSAEWEGLYNSRSFG